MKTTEHYIGELIFSVIDRLNDRVPADDGDRILDEIMPEINAIICNESWHNHQSWICCKCNNLNRKKFMSYNSLCNCWLDKPWLKQFLQK